MATFSEHVKACFGIVKIHPHQFETIICSIEVLKKQDILLACHTGGGKSLCYQSFPVVWETTSGTNGNAIIVVVSPLISIMVEQVTILNSLGFTATYIGMDNADEKRVMDGYFQFVFGSPESIVVNVKWRDMFRTHVYRDKLKLMVTDEAHTVIDW